MAGSLIIRRARPVFPDGEPAAPLVDLVLRDGRIAALGPAGSVGYAEAAPEIDADGRWLIPGLWDQHVHLRQWSRAESRLDLSGAGSAAQVCRMLTERGVAAGSGPLIAFGHRSAVWPDRASVAGLDAVTGTRPVILISGDAHQGWLNSAALRLLDLPPREEALTEDEWFAVSPAVEALGAGEPEQAAYARALAAAARRGIVGLTDFEFGDGWRTWPAAYAGELGRLRIRVACYADELDAVLAAGLRTGDPLDPTGRLRMGPFKIISDGSLNTRTAWCCDPYAANDHDSPDHGQANQTLAELTELLSRAHSGGLRVAVHAIGDRAADDALTALEASGARGTIEHAQLLRRSDITRMARLGVTASVQPAHLLDDRDVAEQVWPGRTDRCFMFGSLARAGVPLVLGSDAPVAPLDPWLAMAAAVGRSGDERPAWHAAEALSPRQALAASTGGVDAVVSGGPADLVLLDRDPLAPANDAPAAAAALRQMPVALTVVDGSPVAGPLAG